MMNDMQVSGQLFLIQRMIQEIRSGLRDGTVKYSDMGELQSSLDRIESEVGWFAWDIEKKATENK